MTKLMLSCLVFFFFFFFADPKNDPIRDFFDPLQPYQRVTQMYWH